MLALCVFLGCAFFIIRGGVPSFFRSSETRSPGSAICNLCCLMYRYPQQCQVSLSEIDWFWQQDTANATQNCHTQRDGFGSLPHRPIRTHARPILVLMITTRKSRVYTKQHARCSILHGGKNLKDNLDFAKLRRQRRCRLNSSVLKSTVTQTIETSADLSKLSPFRISLNFIEDDEAFRLVLGDQ